MHVAELSALFLPLLVSQLPAARRALTSDSSGRGYERSSEAAKPLQSLTVATVYTLLHRYTAENALDAGEADGLPSRCRQPARGDHGICDGKRARVSHLLPGTISKPTDRAVGFSNFSGLSVGFSTITRISAGPFVWPE